MQTRCQAGNGLEIRSFREERNRGVKNSNTREIASECPKRHSHCAVRARAGYWPGVSETPIADKIEAAVRARDVAEARKGIRLFLKKEGGRPAGRAQVAEWYRRLGLYREAYLAVAPKSNAARQRASAMAQRPSRTTRAPRRLAGPAS